ncbi:MAG: hypothetical protein L3J36_15805 [Rhodobacteraceae bacterium]|nr:hypothetical protein [Paracoccaceae bacterium]
MTNHQLQFEKRLTLLARKHNAMSRGYVMHMRPDGLIIARPKRQSSRLPRKAVILFLLAFFGFKAFLVANLGPQTYDDRVARLQAGTIVEQGGAFVMQADPLTLYLARQIGPILR